MDHPIARRTVVQMIVGNDHVGQPADLLHALQLSANALSFVQHRDEDHVARSARKEVVNLGSRHLPVERTGLGEGLRLRFRRADRGRDAEPAHSGDRRRGQCDRELPHQISP